MSERLGTLSTSHEENLLKLRVTVMMQDEIAVTEDTIIHLHWALEADSLIISSEEVPFKVLTLSIFAKIKFMSLGGRKMRKVNRIDPNIW